MRDHSRLFYACIAALLLAETGLCPVPVQAQEMATPRPVMIVRFNEAQVHYEQQLYDVISQAVAIKPDVTFDVVSYAPATGDSDTDEKWQQVAGHHTQLVVASLQRIGVPMARIRVSGQGQPGLRFDETHVYAH